MKRQTVWILAALAAVILLGGAAYMAVRLLNAPAPSGASLTSALSSDPSKKRPGGLSYEITPAAGLPTGQPDFVGNVSSIQDNSVYLTPTSKLDQGSATTYELVIAQETQLYRDTTGDNLPPPPGATSVQQTVSQADRSQFAAGDLVQVWGEKRGTRWIASVVVIHGPAVVK
jgi:hypothetical protein